MSLLRRILPGMPRVGERVEIYQRGRKIAAGRVICIDDQIVSIAGAGIVDLDMEELRRGVRDGSIIVKRQT